MTQLVSRKEIRLSDRSIFYSFDKADEVYKSLPTTKIPVADAVLMLLYAQDKPIHGRTSLMKQVFLLVNEILGSYRVQNPRYVKHRFGMYSFSVANAVSTLEFAGLIERQGRKNTNVERFTLSKKGRKHIAPVFAKLPEHIQRATMDRRKGWDQLGYDGILRYVYQKYPEYRDLSVLKNRYAEIAWGR